MVMFSCPRSSPAEVQSRVVLPHDERDSEYVVQLVQWLTSLAWE